MEWTDEKLMLAVRNGDADKFGVLFERYHQRLFEFFYRMGRDTAASEDLVQEVFLRMLKYRTTFNETSQFRPWMYHIARTARVDVVRKDRLVVSLSEFPGFEMKSGGATPEAALDRRERAAMLARALMELPEDKRELIILARYQEMKYDDIAALLQVDPATLRVRLHRAISELRDIVAKHRVRSSNAM